MGQQKSQPQLFSYAVNLEKRVRVNHPLRQIKALIDFSFVREEVAHCYGTNGNESACVRQGGGQSRPRYKHHRVIDDQRGVITAVETTPGSIAENKKLMGAA